MPPGATRLAPAVLSVSAVGALTLTLWSASLGSTLALIVVPHALFLAWLLNGYLRSGAPDGPIDAPMATAPLYIGSFVIIPAFALA